MKGNDHFIVNESNFSLEKGEESLTEYRFNTKKARHLFCKICGVQSFYRPRSNPDGVGINPRCLDKGTVRSETVMKVDGQNWEKFMEEKGNSIRDQSKAEG
uniref:CENP-V/GFA domain-containing protein n=1 Tax=Chromera velia CCMP2878 TaxID=1169474 RepID=A0A0G4I9V9_9ALVE|eukprot:Cvel_12285.t1-p1 / transcript=Cvel_12285.t1 / gene=Cvel_12285 / organism=Chromera_velia_CCMP2878 / gene_product=Centromere protein V, putative / transcript_product=Centromere protein V, putative / location=Cvel_scaffold797:28221-30757(-) / protein_length=100 / sequence_SO=supercontig / SO=protein_coding / is_pseudo=false